MRTQRICRLWPWLVILAMTWPARGQMITQPVPQAATDAEVAAGTSTRKYVSPATLKTVTDGITAGGISDGDKGDIVVGSSGASWLLDEITRNAIGTTSTDGLVLENTTAATSSVQQWSPRIRFRGYGWDSTAGASKPIDYAIELTPSSAPSGPRDAFVIRESTDGAAYLDLLTLSHYNGWGLFGSGSVSGAVAANRVGSASSIDGFIAATITPATSGNQKYSPRTRWAGNGWKTDATAGSQAVNFAAEVRPEQGAAAPTGKWFLASDVNGGGYSDWLSVDTAGQVKVLASTASSSTTTGALVVAGGIGTGALSVMHSLNVKGGSEVFEIRADGGTARMGSTSAAPTALFSTQDLRLLANLDLGGTARSIVLGTPGSAWDPASTPTSWLTVGASSATFAGTIAMTSISGQTIERFYPLMNEAPASNNATVGARNAIIVLEFGASADQAAVWSGIMPQRVTLTSGLKVILHWMGATATSGDVRWDVSFERGSTDLDSDSFDSVTSATATANGTSGILTKTEITCTSIDSIAAGDSYRIKVVRDQDHAADTMTGSAQLRAVEIRQVN